MIQPDDSAFSNMPMPAAASYSRSVLYLFALIGVAAVVGALWAALRPQATLTRPRRPRVLPPDDDPEFLRRLNERRRDDGRPS
jgi:hypothetical protein